MSDKENCGLQPMDFSNQKTVARMVDEKGAAVI